MKHSIISRLSIRNRLTILICTLLLSIIFIFGWISYVGVKKASIKVAEDRLNSLSTQLSSMMSSNLNNSLSITHTTANKPAIRQFFITKGKDSAEATLKILNELRKDSVYEQVELFNADMKSILYSSRSQNIIKTNVSEFTKLQSNGKSFTGKAGKLTIRDTSVLYPLLVTVTDNQKLLGYLVRWRKMSMNSKSLEQLSKFMGTEGKVYMGNADGTLWTDMMKPVSGIKMKYEQTKPLIEYSNNENKGMMASLAFIPESNWIIAVEMPKSKILEAANSFLYWIISAALILLTVGFFAVWLMSLNITRPLKNFTVAASEIASGNYKTLAETKRFDEIGKLARAFNAMVAEVQRSQMELYNKAENYKLLFENNPMPMWILNRSTLEVKDVNEAALNHYGYSKEEFLTLSSKDLRPQEDVERYLAYINKPSDQNRHNIWRHKKKDGTIIMVDVIADDIMYRGEQARLVLANDVTEKLNAEAELIRHRFMQQQLITETTIQAQEKERESLAKELHDNINQILTSTKLYLEMATGENKELVPDAVFKSYNNVKRVIGEIRQLSKQLVPPSLGTTLADAIQDLSQEIQTITPIRFTVNVSKFKEDVLHDTMKIMLYRIVQEQVNNILKHAAASEVVIVLSNDVSNIHLHIIDNGVGFDPNRKSKGIGLRNIDNRVKFYRGTAFVTSQKGKGCRMDITIPLEKETVLNVMM